MFFVSAGHFVEWGDDVWHVDGPGADGADHQHGIGPGHVGYFAGHAASTRSIVMAKLFGRAGPAAHLADFVCAEFAARAAADMQLRFLPWVQNRRFGGAGWGHCGRHFGGTAVAGSLVRRVCGHDGFDTGQIGDDGAGGQLYGRCLNQTVQQQPHLAGCRQPVRYE